MVFFQFVLLLGYAYAHWLTSRIRGPRQSAIHMALLLASSQYLAHFHVPQVASASARASSIRPPASHSR